MFGTALGTALRPGVGQQAWGRPPAAGAGRQSKRGRGAARRRRPEQARAAAAPGSPAAGTRRPAGTGAACRRLLRRRAAVPIISLSAAISGYCMPRAQAMCTIPRAPYSSNCQRTEGKQHCALGQLSRGNGVAARLCAHEY